MFAGSFVLTFRNVHWTFLSTLSVGSWYSSYVNWLLSRRNKHFSMYLLRFNMTIPLPFSCFNITIYLFLNKLFIIARCLYGVFTLWYFSQSDSNFVFILSILCFGRSDTSLTTSNICVNFLTCYISRKSLCFLYFIDFIALIVLLLFE